MNKYEGFVGKILDGRYKILELVGLGGMACVLKAQDIVMNRIVAIKILNEEYNGDEAAETRFLDESKAVAMLSSKNIVNVFDVIFYPDIKYLVMEYLDGITLREYLDNKGALDWREASFYILQILHALEHAHSKGIIHRDIKPQNVMLMKNGDIKVTDFGIAKLPDSVSDQKDEKAVGTVYYISPEQACGKETDYYSDIYSVGVMFYEAITGVLPFTAETPMEIAVMQVNDDPVHPRDLVIDIPIGVAQIILKAMEKSPDERFQSAHAMTKAIEWVLKYPDVIFAVDSSAAEESPTGSSSVVSIDMISTSELEPFEEDTPTEVTPPKKDPSTTVTKPKTKKQPKPQGQKPKKKKKRSKSMFPIISGVSFAFLLVAVIILITVGVGALRDFLTPAETPEAIYPDLTKDGVYYTEELVNNLLNGKGYGAKFVIDEVIYDSRDDLENNKIIMTEPKGGHSSKPGSDGKLHFSQITVNRSEKVIIPNVNGYPKTAAETALTKLGLKVEVLEMPNYDNLYYNANQVMDISPAYGTEIKVGDTVVITICKRDEVDHTGKMPNLIGMTQLDAIKFAQTYARYTLVFEEVQIPDGNNRVIEQSVEAGTISPTGTVVNVKIGVPLKNFIMPNLDGLTPEQIDEAMAIAAPDVNINIVHHYFSMDQNMSPYFEPESAPITNLNDYISLVEVYDGKQLLLYDYKGVATFQSVAPDTETPKDIERIDVVFITYFERNQTPDVSEPIEDENSSAENGDILFPDEDSNQDEAVVEP